MHCLYDKDFNLNQELLNLINSFNSHNILVVNKFRKKGLDLVKKSSLGRNSNWEAFSLEENEINKDNPKYFKELLRNSTSNLKKLCILTMTKRTLKLHKD